MPSATSMWKRRGSILQPFKETDKRFVEWDNLFQEALSYDKRQETYIAISIYERLVATIEASVDLSTESHFKGGAGLTDEQKTTASDCALCLKYRMINLQKPNECKWMTIKEIAKLKPLFKEGLIMEEHIFF